MSPWKGFKESSPFLSNHLLRNLSIVSSSPVASCNISLSILLEPLNLSILMILPTFLEMMRKFLPDPLLKASFCNRRTRVHFGAQDRPSQSITCRRKGAIGPGIHTFPSACRFQHSVVLPPAMCGKKYMVADRRVFFATRPTYGAAAHALMTRRLTTKGLRLTRGSDKCRKLRLL